MALQKKDWAPFFICAAVFALALLGVVHGIRASNTPQRPAETAAQAAARRAIIARQTAAQAAEATMATERARLQWEQREQAARKCQAILKEAGRLGVLRSVDPGNRVSGFVVAGPEFFKIPFNDKQAIARVASCVVTTANRDHCATLEISDWLNNKKVGTLNSACQLEML